MPVHRCLCLSCLQEKKTAATGEKWMDKAKDVTLQSVPCEDCSSAHLLQ